MQSTSSSLPRRLARAAAVAGCVFAVYTCGDQGKFTTSPRTSGSGTPPSGTWVFPPLDTTVVAGDSFLASFQATDGGGVAKVTFSGYSVQGDSSLGTFSTTPRYTAIGATMPTPQPKDTTLTRYFISLPGGSTDSVFLAATVTNIGGRSATIVRRIQVLGDTVKPGDTIQFPAKTPIFTIAAGDSVLVRTHVMDNRGVVSLELTGVAKRGSVLLGTDTVVPRYTARTVKLPQSTDTVITRYLRAATPVDSTSEYVYVIATAKDSAGNVRADTTQIRVVKGPSVTMLAPGDSSLTSPGKVITISVHAKGTLGVRVLGWRVSGGVPNASDSIVKAMAALTDTLTFTSTYTVPAGTATPSQFSVTGFAVDSNGNPSPAVPPRTVLVQSLTTADNTPPLVTFTVPLRAEVGDSVTVIATDAGGLKKLGFVVRNLAGAVMALDSVYGAAYGLDGTQTYKSYTFRLGLDTISTFPRLVTVEAFAYDSVANCGNSSFSGVPKRCAFPANADQDTVTIVAGRTVALPQGGAIGDAIVDPSHGAGADPVLLLSNTPLDQLEVFHLSTKVFGAPIRVGSEPVGLALWPRDTLGNNADSVIVANSGGTNLSLVNVAGGVEMRRRPVPNWSVGTLRTQANAGGGLDLIFKEYQLADRPQYVGATCRKGAITACDSVIVVYSTAPTAAQPSPFANRGYLAWENITAPLGAHGAGHLFYEQSPLGSSPDTLIVVAVRDTIPGVAIRDTIVGPGAGLLNSIAGIGFQDSTFVRNTGNFVHALMGEGGLNEGFARALTYDATKGVTTVSGGTCMVAGVPLSCTALVDSGISPAAYVNDFVVNHASPVLSIATNFNGRTNLIRADSIYAFDWTLKQSGLMVVPSGNAGMDFDPKNDWNAAARTGTNKNDRLVFAARPDAGIDVFDTYWYQRIATVPIRDTLTGPIRVANTGGALILAGVTSRGVVVVTLPSFTNPLPVQQPMLLAAPTTPKPRVIPQRPAQVLKRAALPR